MSKQSTVVSVVHGISFTVILIFLSAGGSGHPDIMWDWHFSKALAVLSVGHKIFANRFIDLIT